MMSLNNHVARWIFWLTAGSLVLAATWVLWIYPYPFSRRNNTPVNAAGKKPDLEKAPNGDEDDPPAPPEPASVKVLHPRLGAMDRITQQLATVKAGESVQLDAKVSGFLKEQTVDIGDRVTKGKVLAVIHVPELEKQAQRNAAMVELAQARVAQMNAKVAITKADVEAAKAQIGFTEAQARAAGATVKYRGTRYKQMKMLADLKSLEAIVEDIAKEHYDDAIEKENAAKAAIITSKAQVLSAEAKILSAEADVGAAQAEVKVAQAELEKTQVQLAYATICAPWDGIITNRTLFPGAFVRSAGDSGSQTSLLTIQRTDRMRAIVYIPDREVRYADPGDPAVLELDAFPGESFQGKISRIAASEDASTRMMPAEIDLENKDGRIRQGMFGRATIYLEKAIKTLSIPTTCLVGKSDDGKGAVYVVRDGKAYRTPIKIGMENHGRVEVVTGLKISDTVIYQPTTALADGAEVETSLIEENNQKTAAEQP